MNPFAFRRWQLIARAHCSHGDTFTMPDGRVWCYICTRWVK